ncbi:helix-turn-helix domain-containing protein [Proteus sp. TSJ240517]|uniref:helix-turn-helix domain-containing protein n=1 Tax=Proteus sp. TSJ240517 TaxID=3399622 RepID=UPI003A4DF633
MSNKLNNMLELAKELNAAGISPDSLVQEIESIVHTREINDKIQCVSAMSGAEIKTLRTKFGMSQAVLARALGMSKESVSKWERGEKKPSGPALRMLRILERQGPEVLII